MTKQILLVCAGILALFSSCTFQKRHYTKGIYIEKRQSKQPAAINSFYKQKRTLVVPDAMQLSAGKSNSVIILPRVRSENFCDTIIYTKSGRKDVCHITNENATYYRIKSCNGTQYTDVPKKQVRQIILDTSLHKGNYIPLLVESNRTERMSGGGTDFSTGGTIASLVLTGLGFVSLFYSVALAFICFLLGFIFGFMGIRGDMKGLATTCLVICMVLAIVTAIVLLA